MIVSYKQNAKNKLSRHFFGFLATWKHHTYYIGSLTLSMLFCKCKKLPISNNHVKLFYHIRRVLCSNTKVAYQISPDKYTWFCYVGKHFPEIYWHHKPLCIFSLFLTDKGTIFLVAKDQNKIKGSCNVDCYKWQVYFEEKNVVKCLTGKCISKWNKNE